MELFVCCFRSYYLYVAAFPSAVFNFIDCAQLRSDNCLFGIRINRMPGPLDVSGIVSVLQSKSSAFEDVMKALDKLQVRILASPLIS